MTTFSDLPLDILVLIFPYLDAQSFLALCATCQSFNHPNIRLESSYWSHAARSKFRVRNRPVIQADGLHWQRLYKRLLTQSRVFTWGQNTHGCLGSGIESVPASYMLHQGMPHGMPRRAHIRANDQGWPTEMKGAQELGVVADIQCGGWSTSLLNDKGILYTAGVLNGQSRIGTFGELRPVKFPAGAVNSGPHIALRQFSQGRSHILGLSDDNTIWSWYDANVEGTPVSLNNLGSMETGSGRVRSVVAGWTMSSAFLPGSGIILWNAIKHDNEEAVTQINEWVIVPRSGYRRPKGNQREPDESTRVMGKEIGEVTNYIVLEHHVVFVTDIQKLFATRIDWNRESGFVHDSFELLELQSLSTEDTTPSVTDVQGSFRTFAALKKDGQVIIANDDYLDACANQAFNDDSKPLPTTTKIPALQHTGVISLAFGDYHYHALHSDGTISSYGVEPQSCGALGLGQGVGTLRPGTLRGVKYQDRFGASDGILLPHAYFRGRRIWFQPESQKWLSFLANGGSDPVESLERKEMFSVPPIQGEVSEWIEQMGEKWDKRPAVVQKDDDGLGAYFALSVAAAGWHSGALVLVNDKLVQAVSASCLVDLPAPENRAESSTQERTTSLFNILNRSWRDVLALIYNEGQGQEHEQIQHHPFDPPEGKRYIWSEESFPRLHLDHGVDMPGRVPFSTWKEPKPDWKLVWRQGSANKVFGVEAWEYTE